MRGRNLGTPKAGQILKGASDETLVSVRKSRQLSGTPRSGPAAKYPNRAYLVWRDDDGPWMVAGPDIDWFRGDGPPPDIEGLIVSRAVRVRKRLPPNALSTRAKLNRAPNAREGSATIQPNKNKVSETSAKRSCRANQSNGKITRVMSGKPSCAAARLKRAAYKSAASPARKANKGRTVFLKSAQIRSNPLAVPGETTEPRAPACGQDP